MRRAFTLLTTITIAIGFAASANAWDRYGDAADGDSRASPTPLLTWPGKTQVAQPAPRDQRYLAPRGAAPTNVYDPPPARWRPVDNATAQPAPAAAPARAGDGLPPRFYSVARQYGVQPDPVQLSPQFLATTPPSDMAEPPPLPPPHTAGPQSANMSAAAATNQVRQSQEAAQDADSAALGN